LCVPDDSPGAEPTLPLAAFPQKAAKRAYPDGKAYLLGKGGPGDMPSCTRRAICAGLAGAIVAGSARPSTGQSRTGLDAAQRKAEIERRTRAPSAEGLDRKMRSIARLKAEGVPTIDHLPVIETVGEAKLRSADEIARRALALVVVALKGEGADQALVNKVAADLGVDADLSPKERAFLGNAAPSKNELLQFEWRYEALHVLLWAIGFVDKLERPDRTVDVQATVKLFVDNKRAGLMAKARLRPAAEILDAADLIYRYHWATSEAELKGQPAPAGLDSDVVLERHHALNWLIGYAGQAWDDVSTDT
jgi:hypothetical protein